MQIYTKALPYKKPIKTPKIYPCSNLLGYQHAIKTPQAIEKIFNSKDKQKDEDLKPIFEDQEKSIIPRNSSP